MVKSIQLQQLATRIFVAMKHFSDARYTGQIQFQLTMNKGGVSRTSISTQAPFECDIDAQEPEHVAPVAPVQRQEPATRGAYAAPTIGLIATMSKKE